MPALLTVAFLLEFQINFDQAICFHEIKTAMHGITEFVAPVSKIRVHGKVSITASSHLSNMFCLSKLLYCNGKLMLVNYHLYNHHGKM